MGTAEIGRWSPPGVVRLTRTLGLASLEAISVGLAGWTISAHPLIPAYALRNELNPQLRRWAFVNMGAALGVAATIMVALFVWKRRHGFSVLERLVRRAAPLSVAALVPFLFDHRLWADRDLVFLPLVVVFGVGVAVAFRTAWCTEPAFPGLAALSARLRARFKARRSAPAIRIDVPLLLVAAGACAYAVYFSVFTIANHRNFGTSAFDMGGENNLMWNLVHGGPLFKAAPFLGPSPATHFGHHATFFSYVIAPIYWCRQRPDTLLVVQATMLGGAAIPLYLYATLHLPRWIAALISYLYLGYPPLHGANLYDFHYLPLGVLFLWLVLYAVEARRRVLAVVATILALSVREDVAFCLAFLGLFLVFAGSAPRSGVLLALVGGGYFLVMKLGVMPHFAGGGETFVNQYAGLLPEGERSFGSMLKTIVGNPVFTANVVFEHDKLAYFFKLFAPLLFLPFLMPIGVLLGFPGFIFTLLSTGYWPLYQISFQYTSYWTVFAFIGVVLALERAGRARHGADHLGRIRQRALAVGLFAASLACSYLYGAIVPHANLRAGFEYPRIEATDFDVRRNAELRAILPQIPADAKLSGSEHLLPRVSGRRDAYTLRVGVFDADYLLFEIPIRSDERSNAAPLLRNETFGIVDDLGDMALAKRGYSTAKNAAVLARIE